jgi:hypothetical protein
VDELVPIDAVPKEDLGSDVLDDVWRQLRRAHAAGLTHRDLTADNVQVDGSGAVWLTGWERGEVASTEMSRRMDLAQALALLGAVAGPGRALASAPSPGSRWRRSPRCCSAWPFRCRRGRRCGASPSSCAR